MYDYLIVPFAVLFPAQRLCKKLTLITFVYQKLSHFEISKKCSKIKEFSFVPNFMVKLKAFELTYDYLIVYFAAVFHPSIEHMQKISIS